jgi:lysophospholipase L1-like esterase
MRDWPVKTSLALLTFAATMGALHFVPTSRRPEKLTTATPDPVTPGVAVDTPHLMDRGGALITFYAALERVEAKQPGAVVRVLHFGDSPVTADQITADVRSMLQERFGDAGHGFVLVAKPWAWYGHRGVEVQGKGWKIQPASQARAADGLHGLGGVSFVGQTGASSRIRLESPQQRVELMYLRQPGGGSLAVRAGGGERAGDTELTTISSAAPAKEAGFATIPLPAGCTEIELAVTQGPFRIFGASFEKDGPGVRYSSLGVNGGQVQMVVRYFEVAHWAEQIRHQKPDLIVVNYGTNESSFAGYVNTLYAGELREVIRRIHAAAPGVSVLIMSPMDRGQRDSSGEIVTLPILPRIVEIQRTVAGETGCAFFNTFQAMGGAGTMGRWYAARPRLVTADFMHPFPAGARQVGSSFEEALCDGYRQFKAQRARMDLAQARRRR